MTIHKTATLYQRLYLLNYNQQKARIKKRTEAGKKASEVRHAIEDIQAKKALKNELDWLGMEGEV